MQKYTKYTPKLTSPDYWKQILASRPTANSRAVDAELHALLDQSSQERIEAMAEQRALEREEWHEEEEDYLEHRQELNEHAWRLHCQAFEAKQKVKRAAARARGEKAPEPEEMVEWWDELRGN